MRGARLFNELFVEETLPAPKLQKGRSKDLHDKRNEAIAARYYYYGTFYKLGYINAVESVANDFFLSAYTIPEIVTTQLSFIQSLKKQGATPRELAQRYPQFSWKVDALKFTANV